ncbi:MAG: LytTR family DNA-binding domain-containing protein [Congregibacter sp.]
MTNKRQFRCAVVDDEYLGRELIESHIGQMQQLELVASCASAIEAGEVLGSQSIDLLFLDIEMPILKGTDFYQSLNNPPAVIFTTAYRDYALQGFELEAIDYLLKPVTFPRFFKSVTRFLNTQKTVFPAAQSSSELPPTSLFVRADRKDVRLKTADIDYVQGLKDYIRIHTPDTVYTVKETMASFSERLGTDFVRVHRSYLVNRHRVTALTRVDVEIGEKEIPIGETFRESALLELGAVSSKSP